MPTATLATLDAAAIADLAVTALRSEADLTPKPGLVDGRGPGAHTDMTLPTLHDSADALRVALTECASAAAEMEVGPDLRAEIGAIGRAGERAMLAATGGVNTHRGALWALGLLGAGAAQGGGIGVVVDRAARLAEIPDPALGGSHGISHGTLARRQFGALGAKGEAQCGFPHVLDHALPTLRAARMRGADETTARLDALLALMASLDDTCLLHRGGRAGLRDVRAGAAATLLAGGFGTAAGRAQFAGLDRLCADRGLSPGGSGDLLSATLFLDALEGIPATCKL